MSGVLENILARLDRMEKTLECIAAALSIDTASEAGTQDTRTMENIIAESLLYQAMNKGTKSVFDEIVAVGGGWWGKLHKTGLFSYVPALNKPTYTVQEIVPSDSALVSDTNRLLWNAIVFQCYLHNHQGSMFEAIIDKDIISKIPDKLLNELLPDDCGYVMMDRLFKECRVRNAARRTICLAVPKLIERVYAAGVPKTDLQYVTLSRDGIMFIHTSQQIFQCDLNDPEFASHSLNRIVRLHEYFTK